ncbi:MAG: FKBP-type peptidyl-prolyl cis-trans isomerase [Bacteroidales bacterium]|nr:FKBP-type peptidyl-prolyl cis-trans isomerase [Bacteroidales bacterium]MCF8454429.1 FKBP-type peptidyl-prolyl cis-trans isomerase [Bacteroidales bacterium]
MVIEKNKVVSLTYELRANEKSSEIVEKVNADRPLVFLYGSQNMLPAFEEQLGGLKCGDTFDFMLTAEQGYGPIDERAIVDLGKDIFMSDGQERDDLLFVGNMIPMRDSNGNRMDGKVIEIGESTVKLDFNHPMAGSSLFFTGEIVDMREATEEEMQHGHIHAEESDCSGGCSHCGDGHGTC